MLFSLWYLAIVYVYMVAIVFSLCVAPSRAENCEWTPAHLFRTEHSFSLYVYSRITLETRPTEIDDTNSNIKTNTIMIIRCIVLYVFLNEIDVSFMEDNMNFFSTSNIHKSSTFLNITQLLDRRSMNKLVKSMMDTIHI